MEFSINTSGISQAFTIMMALAGNFDSKGGQNIGREPATGYDSFMFDVVPNKEGRMGKRRMETAKNIKKLSVCQNTGYQQILVADDATGELRETTQNSGGQVIYGQQGGFGAEISATVAEEAMEYLDAPILRYGAPFCPIPFAPTLEKMVKVVPEDLVKGIKGMV